MKKISEKDKRIMVECILQDLNIQGMSFNLKNRQIIIGFLSEKLHKSLSSEGGDFSFGDLANYFYRVVNFIKKEKKRIYGFYSSRILILLENLYNLKSLINRVRTNIPVEEKEKFLEDVFYSVSIHPFSLSNFFVKIKESAPFFYDPDVFFSLFSCLKNVRFFDRLFGLFFHKNIIGKKKSSDQRKINLKRLCLGMQALDEVFLTQKMSQLRVDLDLINFLIIEGVKVEILRSPPLSELRDQLLWTDIENSLKNLGREDALENIDVVLLELSRALELFKKNNRLNGHTVLCLLQLGYATDITMMATFISELSDSAFEYLMAFPNPVQSLLEQYPTQKILLSHLLAEVKKDPSWGLFSEYIQSIKNEGILQCLNDSIVTLYCSDLLWPDTLGALLDPAVIIKKESLESMVDYIRGSDFNLYLSSQQIVEGWKKEGLEHEEPTEVIAPLLWAASLSIESLNEGEEVFNALKPLEGTRKRCVPVLL